MQDRVVDKEGFGGNRGAIFRTAQDEDFQERQWRSLGKLG